MSQPTILFVDDEVAVLRAMQRIFRKHDVKTLTASSADEGLKLFENHDIDVVVSDQRMAGMSGTDFLKVVRLQYPDTVRCILSGYAEMDSVVAAINDGHVYRFISKPWDDAEFQSILKSCLVVAENVKSERRAQSSLQHKATALENESDKLIKLFEIQEALLKSSRAVLDLLPVGIAALDENHCLIYVNRCFFDEFGHLPGATLGQTAGEPWISAARVNAFGETQIKVGDSTVLACTNQIEISGQAHTLLAIYPARKRL